MFVGEMMLGLSSLFWNLLIIVLFSTGLFFSGYGLGYKFTKEKYEKLEMQAQVKAQQRQREIHNEYIHALNDARAREEALLNDFSDLHSTHQRLRDAVQNSLPKNASNAELDAILTRGELFTTCSQEYANLAEKADRHVHDIRTIEDVWRAVEKSQ